MGFNSWNFYHCNIDEVTLRAVVDAIETNGMKEAGYSYVNIDDCWQVRREERERRGEKRREGETEHALYCVPCAV